MLLHSNVESTHRFNGWTHLELGAGNYGLDGHTKASQAKTVLMKFREVSGAKNYIDALEEFGRSDYKPEDQYAVLFSTLDELVNRHGPVGVFHVNDLYEDYANFAACKLKEYADAQEYHSIIIEAVSGDYQFLDPEKHLLKYGKKKYQSVHLKNPELSFYHDKMDGGKFSSSEKSREETRTLLTHLANLSEEGLYLFITYYDTDVNFVPDEEKKEFMDKNIFYHHTDKWASFPYILPEGTVTGSEHGKVFFIEAAKSFQQ